MNKGVVIVYSMHYSFLTYMQAMIRGRIIFEEGGNDMNQPMSKLNSQDPFHGIRGTMTRARSKKMKATLNGLIKEMQEKEVVFSELEDQPRLINYLKVQDDGMGLAIEECSELLKA